MNPNNNDPTNTPPADNPTPEAAPATPSVDQPVAEQPTFQPGTTPVVESVPTPDATVPSNETPSATPFVAASAGAPDPKKSNTKKIILIASIAAGAVILAIIAFVVFSLLTTVSKQDYRAAATQFNDVSRASSRLNSEAMSLGSSAGANTTDSEFEASVKDAKDAVATLKSENEELSKLKAVRVGEGGTLYKAFDDKLEAYFTYADGLIASVEGLRPAKVVCDKTGTASDAAARVASLKECSAALANIKDLPNESFKAFVDKLKTGYAEYTEAFEKTSALSNPYGAQFEEYRTLRDKMTAAQRSISTASRDFANSLNESDKKYSVKDSADALADYLTEQQRK